MPVIQYQCPRSKSELEREHCISKKTVTIHAPFLCGHFTSHSGHIWRPSFLTSCLSTAYHEKQQVLGCRLSTPLGSLPVVYSIGSQELFSDTELKIFPTRLLSPLPAFPRRASHFSWNHWEINPSSPWQPFLHIFWSLWWFLSWHKSYPI